MDESMSRQNVLFLSTAVGRRQAFEELETSAHLGSIAAH
jgi:hypothetical protein